VRYSCSATLFHRSIINGGWEEQGGLSTPGFTSFSVNRWRNPGESHCEIHTISVASLGMR
jgi:hypothetical protein